jgi:hypothetical protein
MSNTFDFKRFGQVLAKDWKNYFRNFGISLIVWCCIPVLFWIATLVLDFEMDNGARAAIIASLVFSVLIFVPSKVYGKANLSRDGVGFAMLPATNLEKFLSMFLYCSVLTPLIVGLGSWAIDSLLYLLPFGGFTYYFVVLPKSKLGLLLVTIACYGLLFSSIFVFGNMVFKKPKAGKTIAWGLLILFVLAMILQLFHFWERFTHWECNTVNQNALPWIMDAVFLGFAIVFYVLTYRKLKTQKY